MLAEDFHKSAEGFMEKNVSESGDFGAGCGRLWIYQQNVNLFKYKENRCNTLNESTVTEQRLWLYPEILDRSMNRGSNH